MKCGFTLLEVMLALAADFVVPQDAL
ncbi:prepilin-type N-terminal cleavage/methylation domain-containing protein [Escherichia coli]